MDRDERMHAIAALVLLLIITAPIFWFWFWPWLWAHGWGWWYLAAVAALPFLFAIVFAIVCAIAEWIKDLASDRKRLAEYRKTALMIAGAIAILWVLGEALVYLE
jgi:hypothetical protein